MCHILEDNIIKMEILAHFEKMEMKFIWNWWTLNSQINHEKEQC